MLSRGQGFAGGDVITLCLGTEQVLAISEAILARMEQLATQPRSEERDALLVMLSMTSEQIVAQFAQRVIAAQCRLN